MTHLPK